MAWDFETTPDFQRELDWMARFVREEIEPLDHVLGSPWDIHASGFKRLVRPLQRIVKERRLWACHLGPELGGQGYGEVTLALMNEILGRSTFAPVVFGAQAPDSGNSEILAHYGTQEQKKRYLDPLLANDVERELAGLDPELGHVGFVDQAKDLADVVLVQRSGQHRVDGVQQVVDVGASGGGVREIEVPVGVGGADDPVVAPRDDEQHRHLGAHRVCRWC